MGCRAKLMQIICDLMPARDEVCMELWAMGVDDVIQCKCQIEGYRESEVFGVLVDARHVCWAQMIVTVDRCLLYTEVVAVDGVLTIKGMGVYVRGECVYNSPAQGKRMWLLRD